MKNIHVLPAKNYKEDYKLQNGSFIEVVKLGQLIFDNSLKEFRINKNKSWSASCDTNVLIPQHIYITSDEEIKEGDWYCSPTGIVSQHNGTEKLPDGWKKIIATTDKSLKINLLEGIKHAPENWRELPQIPQSFIEYFVDQYNKGNIITEVMVEYELGNISESYFDGEKEKLPLHLKINPDNTINIKPSKDSWNIKELSGILSIYKQYIFSKTGREIEEIYDKEVLEPIRQEEWQESQVNRRYLKSNQKQFKQFDESLHKAYLNKFSDEDKFKAFISNLNELSKEVQFNAFLATLRKMKLDSQTESNIMMLVALKDI